VKSRICGGGRKIARHRRLQALHAPAFLIDQNEKIGSANCFANLGHEALQLLSGRDVATKQDQPCRLNFAVKAPFFIRQSWAREAGDQSRDHAG
jgi:hypothetical protein